MCPNSAVNMSRGPIRSEQEVWNTDGRERNSYTDDANNQFFRRKFSFRYLYRQEQLRTLSQFGEWRKADGHVNQVVQFKLFATPYQKYWIEIPGVGNVWWDSLAVYLYRIVWQHLSFLKGRPSAASLSEHLPSGRIEDIMCDPFRKSSVVENPYQHAHDHSGNQRDWSF